MITNTYAIPTDLIETLKKSVSKLMKKANEYSKLFTVSYGETPYLKKKTVYGYNYEDNSCNIICKKKIEVIDVTITSENIVKDGYTVVAMLEHLDSGNVVTYFTEDRNLDWNTIGSRCDHCGHKRIRSKTFIVKDVNGEYKQIGKNCLKDYCGINPQNIGISCSLKDLFVDYNFDNFNESSFSISSIYDIKEVIALSYRLYKKYGYRSSDSENSNKEALVQVVESGKIASEEELKYAEQIIEDIKSMDMQDAINNFLDNVKTLCECGYCKQKHFGYIAYDPVAYEKYLDKNENEKHRKEEKINESNTSNYVGNIGDKIHIQIDSMKLITSWETQYGFTYLYKFVSDGNVFIWYASHTINDTKNIKTISASIKDHSERDGVKQTVITRCKVI